MDDKKWEKLAALGGVVFVVFNLVGIIAPGSPPSADDTNDEVLKWFVDNASGIKIAALMPGLSIIALVWWFGSLWRRMSKAENGNHRLSVVALVGLAASGALYLASVSVVATVAIQVDEVGADPAKFFYVLSAVLLSMAGPVLAVHLLGVNAIALRSGFLPKWVGYLGVFSAVLQASSLLGATTDADPATLLGFAAFIIWSIWIVVVSVHMWRTADVN